MIYAYNKITQYLSVRGLLRLTADRHLAGSLAPPHIQLKDLLCKIFHRFTKKALKTKQRIISQLHITKPKLNLAGRCRVVLFRLVLFSISQLQTSSQSYKLQSSHTSQDREFAFNKHWAYIHHMGSLHIWNFFKEGGEGQLNNHPLCIASLKGFSFFDVCCEIKPFHFSIFTSTASRLYWSYFV